MIRVSLLSTIIALAILAAVEAGPNHSNTGRTLYDRNQSLRRYQRQRAEPCGSCAKRNHYYEYNNESYFIRKNPYDMTYYAPNAHPDNAGNESR